MAPNIKATTKAPTTMGVRVGEHVSKIFNSIMMISVLMLRKLISRQTERRGQTDNAKGDKHTRTQVELSLARQLQISRREEET